MDQIIIEYAAILISVFVLSAIILRFLIPLLKSKKVGQKILEIGPRWHKSKEGTPTMGGAAFIIAILVCVCVFSVVNDIAVSSAEINKSVITVTIKMYGTINLTNDISSFFVYFAQK